MKTCGNCKWFWEFPTEYMQRIAAYDGTCDAKFYVPITLSYDELENRTNKEIDAIDCHFWEERGHE